MSEPQQDKQAVKQTRDILNARLGEMITGLLGDDNLEKNTPPAQLRTPQAPAPKRQASSARIPKPPF